MTAHILAVEDSLTQAMHLRHLLERAGYRVTVAHDGQDALDRLASVAPDLIVSDIVMPRLDGYGLCKAVKQDPAWRDVPVLLLTSLTDPKDVIRGIDAHADGFVTKPYPPDFLLSRVEHMLKNAEIRRSQPDAADFFFGGERYELPKLGREAVDMLMSTYENAVLQNRALDQANGELTRAVETIRGLEANYRALLDASRDLIVVVGPDGLIRYLNPAARPYFAADGQAPEGSRFPFEILPDQIVEIRLIDTTGLEVIGEMRASQTTWGSEGAWLAAIRDVTENVRLREELRNQSLTDGLTGLYNRRGFVLLGEQQVQVAARRRQPLCVVFIDMDGMKRINDTLGHEFGDRALQDSAELIKRTLRASDLAARLGGDEFATLLHTDRNGTALVVERLQALVMLHNEQAGRPYAVALSCGVAELNPDAPESLDALLKRADALMYADKVRRRAARA